MSKLDELMKSSREIASESMGAARGPAMPRASAPAAAATPDRLQGIARSKNAAEIPLAKIGPDPDQPRSEFDPEDLARLAESLKARGQLQPIRVRWDEARSQYVIVCGERRWRAAELAGLLTMSCVIMEGPITQGELLAMQLVENCVREDLRPIEQARAFKTLMDQNGWSTRQVARELSIAQSNVVRALALLELPESVQAQVEQGTLPPATAYEVSKIDDPERQREVAAEVAAAGLSRAEAVERVRQVTGKRPGRGPKGKGGPAGRPKALKSRVYRSALGRLTIELRKAGDRSAMLELAREFVRTLEAEAAAERGGPSQEAA